MKNDKYSKLTRVTDLVPNSVYLHHGTLTNIIFVKADTIFCETLYGKPVNDYIEGYVFLLCEHTDKISKVDSDDDTHDMLFLENLNDIFSVDINHFVPGFKDYINNLNDQDFKVVYNNTTYRSTDVVSRYNNITKNI